MRDLLQHAGRHGYGVGAFDIVSLEFLTAVVTAAEACRVPVVLSVAEPHSKFVDPEILMPTFAAARRGAPDRFQAAGAAAQRCLGPADGRWQPSIHRRGISSIDRRRGRQGESLRGIVGRRHTHPAAKRKRHAPERLLAPDAGFAGSAPPGSRSVPAVDGERGWSRRLGALPAGAGGRPVSILLAHHPFANAAVIDSYREHPDHVAFADGQFRPIAPDRLSIDLEEIP